jgi:hypothetical protein
MSTLSEAWLAQEARKAGMPIEEYRLLLRAMDDCA